MDDNVDIFNQLNDLLGRAKRKGAYAARASMSSQDSLSVSMRMGKFQSLDRTSAHNVSIEVYKGKKDGEATVNSLRPEHLAMALEEALFNAENSTEDPYVGLADPSQLSDSYPEPDIYDPAVPTVEDLTERARAAEQAGLQGDKIVASRGGEASWGRSSTVIMADNGFCGTSKKSISSIGVGLIAGENGQHENDIDYSSAIYAGDLKNPAEIGEEAARRAAQNLGARQVNSGKFPVVFDPRVARSLIGEFLKAIQGGAVADGHSFLVGKLDQKIFANNVSIIDDPLMDRGLASRRFDSDGIAASKQTLVEQGVLKGWLLSLYSARKLSDKTGRPFTTTGHCGVGANGLNLYMEGGTLTPEELMADIKDGFYVTGLMGHGANTLTGDFSQGASGLWIRNGKPEFAVSGVTLAGSLPDMFANMTPANDVDRKKSNIAVPTLRVEGLTLGGK